MVKREKEILAGIEMLEKLFAKTGQGSEKVQYVETESIENGRKVKRYKIVGMTIQELLRGSVLCSRDPR